MNKRNAILITGTDTGVGKTLVARGLARALCEKGLKTLAVKPVESGVALESSPNEDGVLLAAATGQDHPTQALTRLTCPVAPPVAADREGVELPFEDWVREIEVLSNQADIVLVEGAGGFLSPLTWEASARDLAKRLEAPALLVVGNRLGCVNHTLLTVEALNRAGIPLVGIILSAVGEEDESFETNADTIRRSSSVERIASLPHVTDWRASLPHLKPVLDWITE